MGIVRRGKKNLELSKVRYVYWGEKNVFVCVVFLEE